MSRRTRATPRAVDLKQGRLLSTQGLWTRLLEVLSDGAWHTIPELAAACGSMIGTETASRAYMQHYHRPPKEEQDYLTTAGRTRQRRATYGAWPDDPLKIQRALTAGRWVVVTRYAGAGPSPLPIRYERKVSANGRIMSVRIPKTDEVQA